MKRSIEILKGKVNSDQLDEYDHLAMPNYLKIINNGIMILSNDIFKNTLSNKNKRLVAARCNLEFKNELLLNNEWILNVKFIDFDIKYLTLDFKIRSKSQVKAKAIMVLVAFDLTSRKSVTLSSEEIYILKQLLN